jgi:hypothetical protein
MKATLLCLAVATPLPAPAQSIFPLKISEHRRHFVTQPGKPFRYHADTGWQIFTELTTEEAALRECSLPAPMSLPFC